MKNKLFKSTHLLALGLALSISSAHAAIILVDTGFANTNASGASSGNLTRDVGTYTHAYDAGASFGTLVVTVSRETAANAFSVSYGGVGMNLATGVTSGGSAVSIFYLNTTATSGDIVVNFTNGTNGVGIGIAAIRSDNGDPIGLFDADHGTGTSITIDTADDSFTMFGIDTNLGAFSGLNTSPLTQIFALVDVGSNGAGAAYELVTTGQTGKTYSYTNTASPRGIAAANFVVVPEPSSALLLLGGVGVLAFARRRK